MHPGKTAPSEYVKFVDKIVVFYLAEDMETYLWQLIPRTEIAYIDRERYLFYVNWPLDNYVHGGWWGKKVSERLMSIYNSVIGWLVRVSKTYHLQAWSRERAACVRSIRRRLLRLIGRYSNGAMITPIFRKYLDSFLSAISHNVSVVFQTASEPEILPDSVFVC